MARKRGRSRSRGIKTSSLTSALGGTGIVSQDGAVIRGRDQDDERCALCEREVDRVTVHHLIPRARGGNHGPTARMCPTCHRQVHAMFSETTLAEELYSVNLLRANPRVASFLRWMRKQRGAAFRVRRAKDRA